MTKLTKHQGWSIILYKSQKSLDDPSNLVISLLPPPRRTTMTSGTTTSSSAASIKGSCCCLILLFSFLALLPLVVIPIIVLAIKPKNPQFNLQQVTVQTLTLTTTTITDLPTLSLIIRLLFTAKNDNIDGIKYSDSTFTFMYLGVPMGQGVVRGFYQAARSVKLVQTTVVVDQANVLQANADNLAHFIFMSA